MMRATLLKTLLFIAGALPSSGLALAQDGTVDRIHNGPFRTEIVGHIDIDAPLALVWQVLLDVDAYGVWNPAVLAVDPPEADITRRGERLGLTVPYGSGERTQWVEVQGATPPLGSEICEWVYNTADFAARIGWLRVQRVHQLEPTDQGQTRLMVAEIFKGFIWAAPINQTQQILEAFLQALKGRAEALAAAP